MLVYKSLDIMSDVPKQDRSGCFVDQKWCNTFAKMCCQVPTRDPFGLESYCIIMCLEGSEGEARGMRSEIHLRIAMNNNNEEKHLLVSVDSQKTRSGIYYIDLYHEEEETKSIPNEPNPQTHDQTLTT
jgi:hypothetical protein